MFKYCTSVRRSITGATINSFKGLKMQTNNAVDTNSKPTIITEGKAFVKTSGNVFYNPVQEFNRDLSISVLNVFCQQLRKSVDNTEAPGTVYDDGITILEALSATGLRSIRYAKEVVGVKQILANDFSRQAVESIKLNVQDNSVQDLVTPSEDDAIMLMYKHKSKDQQFDVIDLDPYGCPSRFLDAAVQAVKDGGMLLVTATDMAVLAGKAPETCYSKYGSISLSLKCCHEMALRILLHCIESHANRYGRYIEPILSISADFYIRVFVKVYSGAHKCKYSTSKLSMVYQCNGCDAFTLQPLGVIKKTENSKPDKFRLPTGPPVGATCEHCGNHHYIGGPIWSAPLHNYDFVQQVLTKASTELGTYRRIYGVLSVVLEELTDCPLYYVLESLSGTLHVETPSLMTVRSAILNAGYKVSLTHAHKTSIKTDAPAKVIWDIMRCWELQRPISEKRRAENSPGSRILKIKPEKAYSFEMHPDANPPSRREGCVRFQENPLPYWGPGTKATVMMGDNKMDKSKRNQGKRKREQSEEKSCT